MTYPKVCEIVLFLIDKIGIGFIFLPKMGLKV